MRQVDSLFSQSPYKGNEEAIKSYAVYATRSDGPGLWGAPATLESDPGDADYKVSYET